MQGHQTVLAKLGPADGQHCGVQVDICKLEVERLAQSQARDAPEFGSRTAGGGDERATRVLRTSWVSIRRLRALGRDGGGAGLPPSAPPLCR